MYLHMIVPSKDETNNNTINNDSTFSTDKKVYYEVGCKIFEINKIYK